MIRSWFPLLLGLQVVVTANAAPKEIAELKLLSGRTFRQVTVLAAEPDGLRIYHEHGAGRVGMEELPEQVRKEFGMDPNGAAAFRMEKKRRQDVIDAKEKSATVRRLSEMPRVKQDQEQEALRTEIFEKADGEGYNFAETDTRLQERISLWKEVGRDDLAEVLEADRTTLREREASKGSLEESGKRTALEERILELEQKLARRKAAPAPAPPAPPAVVVVPPPAAPPAQLVVTPDPIYISPPPIILPPPVCPPMPPCPPPVVVTPPPSPPRVAPPAGNGNSNGHMQGSHLWLRR